MAQLPVRALRLSDDDWQALAELARRWGLRTRAEAARVMIAQATRGGPPPEPELPSAGQMMRVMERLGMLTSAQDRQII